MSTLCGYELDSYREQLEAVPFDIPSGDACIPTCLDGASRKYIVELVEDLNPLIENIFESCDTVAKNHGAHEDMDYNAQLFDLKMHTAETGFYIGVLAGAMFSGASKETVDRFERGLLYALRSNGRVVKPQPPWTEDSSN